MDSLNSSSKVNIAQLEREKAHEFKCKHKYDSYTCMVRYAPYLLGW